MFCHQNEFGGRTGTTLRVRHQRLARRSIVLLLPWVAATCLAVSSSVSAEPPRGGPEREVWTAVPSVNAPYVSPNAPLTRLEDVLALHRGENSWTHPVVRTDAFAGDYVSLAPGQSTKATFYGDERAIVWIAKGKLDVEIEGQPRHLATKGYLIDVAPTLIFRMTNIGDEPAVFFRITPAGQLPSYPSSESPLPVEGYEYVKTKMAPYGKYEGPTQPFLDFLADIVGQDAPSRDFAVDGHTSAHIIREPGIPTPPDSNLGHFHAGIPEIWLVLEGNIDAKISGEPLVTGRVGDVIFAEKGRWHRATSSGSGKSTRLAIMPRYIEGLTVFQQVSPGAPVETYSASSANFTSPETIAAPVLP